METLKFYFNDGTVLTVPEGLTKKYIINSVISSYTKNISISILHKLDDVDLLLKAIYTNSIRGKVVTKIERYNNTLMLDSIEGSNLVTSWNLGNDVVAGEEVYNEVITVEGN